MASDYTYAPSADAQEKSAGKIVRGLKKILLVAGIVVLAELIWLFAVSPFIPFSSVEVHGFDGFDKQEILLTAGIDERASFISTNITEVKEKLLSHLLVESAVVMKRFPDKLSIFIYPREAAAVTLASIGSRQIPLYVDRNGVFYKYANTSQFDQRIPVISGFENPQLSMRLPAALVPLVESLSVIANNAPELLATISEIRVERKPWEGFDIVLYPVHSSIKVRLENTLNEDVLRYVLLMLSVLEENSSKPEEIDFRSGMGSYRIGEQS